MALHALADHLVATFAAEEVHRSWRRTISGGCRSSRDTRKARESRAGGKKSMGMDRPTQGKKAAFKRQSVNKGLSKRRLPRRSRPGPLTPRPSWRTGRFRPPIHAVPAYSATSLSGRSSRANTPGAARCGARWPHLWPDGLATDLDTEHGQTHANTCDVARQVGLRNAAELHL